MLFIRGICLLYFIHNFGIVNSYSEKFSLDSSVSKTLNCETKFDFGSEYIGFNLLIYKADDALHRMSSRYIGKEVIK